MCKSILIITYPYDCLRHYNEYLILGEFLSLREYRPFLGPSSCITDDLFTESTKAVGLRTDGKCFMTNKITVKDKMNRL